MHYETPIGSYSDREYRRAETAFLQAKIDLEFRWLCARAGCPKMYIPFVQAAFLQTVMAELSPVIRRVAQFDRGYALACMDVFRMKLPSIVQKGTDTVARFVWEGDFEKQMMNEVDTDDDGCD